MSLTLLIAFAALTVNAQQAQEALPVVDLPFQNRLTSEEQDPKPNTFIGASHVRGVDSADQDTYSGQVPFICNISEFEATILDPARINDDYCDCLDGRDEPGPSK